MADTVIHRFFNQAKIRPGAPAYFAKKSGAYQPTSWQGYVDEVRTAAKSLIALGVPAGGTVCILGFNRPEWVIMNLAAMAVGGAAAGIYTTSSAHEIQYIVDHAEASVVLVETAEHWEKVRSEWERIPKLAHVVIMRGGPSPEVCGFAAANLQPDDPRVLSWEAFLAKGKDVGEALLDERVHALEPAGLALLIYTSGTTGPPKAVMLSHDNLAWTSGHIVRVLEGTSSDRTLSYLPLAHIAEQMFSLHLAVTSGGAVYFAESIEKLADNLKEARPTVFLGVPRIWEKLRAGIEGKFAQAKGAKRALLQFARGVGTEHSAVVCRAGKPSASLRMRHALASRLVFSKLKAALGLDQARVLVVGAAPVARDVLEFFASLDMVIQEVYGQSEDSGPTTFNQPGNIKLGTVGCAVPDIEVKIAADGEILVRGRNVFLGYYKDPEATAETLIDGWLQSGDLGAFDGEGFLNITGRKKEILITAGGKNITPKNIEEGIKAHPLVSEAIVIGDARKYLTALVTLDPDAAARFAEEHGLGAAPLQDSPEIVASVQKTVDQVNERLARVETIKKFTILPRPLSIEKGELTATLKIKRRVINENFAPQIEAMYRD
ncbi:MAG TPA: long-chain fatty acid--CoA ligase [Polyangiaceae bacterium]|nr:long-chain fatty acid--CoA ligase [Polyangiaceae bacterium]